MMSRMSVSPPENLAVDVLVEAQLWSEQMESEEAVRRAVAAAGARLQQGGEICVVLTDDAAIQKLNRTWRQNDKPTNVLSFPAAHMRGISGPALLGDIVIAYETTAGEAMAEGKPFLDHLSHLTVHGFLHLLGYDHENDGQAEEMERLEREILATLGLKDPYFAADIGT